MLGLSSLGPRAKRDRPSTIVTQNLRPRLASSAGKSRTGRINEHAVGLPFVPITHSILRNPLQDYGSRAETRALFRSCAYSESSAGASTSPTTFPLKQSRQHQSAQQPQPSPMDCITRTRVYRPPQPSVQSCFVNHYARPPTSSPLLFPSPRTTSSISFTIMSVAP
jgi:hypothetical protein